MAAPQNFRSAFNGFNRDDVVQYIEYLNAKHTAEVNQLTSEAEFLREKLDNPSQDPLTLQMLASAEAERDDYKKQLDEQLVVMEELEKRCAVLEAERDAALAQTAPTVDTQPLEDQIASLQLELKNALEAKVLAENARDAAIIGRAQAESQRHTAAMHCRVEQELEAYRRAERTERQARERAEQVYRQTNGALADATARIDEAAAQIGEMTDRVMFQLSQLQTAVTGSKQALRDAAATMYSIRPGSTEE